jgi:hypothetical protein
MGGALLLLFSGLGGSEAGSATSFGHLLVRTEGPAAVSRERFRTGGRAGETFGTGVFVTTHTGEGA